MKKKRRKFLLESVAVVAICAAILLYINYHGSSIFALGNKLSQVAATGAAAPTLTGSATNIYLGQSLTLSWNTGIYSCIPLLGGWIGTGTKKGIGSMVVKPPSTGADRYTLNCTGYGQIGFTVNVAAVPIVISASTMQSLLKSTSMSGAITIAQNAKLIVNQYGFNSSQGTLEIRNPNTMKIIAVIRDDEAPSVTKGNGTGGTAECYVATSSPSSVFNNIKLFASSDNHVYGINSNYNVNYSCLSLDPTISCGMVKTALTGSVSAYNTVGAMQGTVGATSNSQSMNVTLYQATPSGATEGAAAEIYSVDFNPTSDFSPTQTDTCNINVYGDRIKESLAEGGATAQQSQNYIGTVIEHEMGHCFGFAHDDQNYIMFGEQGVSNYNWDNSGPDTSISQQEPGMAGIMRLMYTGVSLSVNSCNAMGNCPKGTTLQKGLCVKVFPLKPKGPATKDSSVTQGPPSIPPIIDSSGSVVSSGCSAADLANGGISVPSGGCTFPSGSANSQMCNGPGQPACNLEPGGTCMDSNGNPYACSFGTDASGGGGGDSGTGGGGQNGGFDTEPPPTPPTHT